MDTKKCACRNNAVIVCMQCLLGFCSTCWQKYHGYNPYSQLCRDCEEWEYNTEYDLWVPRRKYG